MDQDTDAAKEEEVMKKKIAVFMAITMVFSNLVSVCGAEISEVSVESVEAAESEEAEDLILSEEEMEEETEDETVVVEESVQEEAVPDSEEDARSDPMKEIQEEAVLSECCGTSSTVQAGTSVYSKGASFGRQKELEELKNLASQRFSYAMYGYAAIPEFINYYIDGSGNLHVVGVHSAEKQLYDAEFDSSMNITGVTKVRLPLPNWGGFYAAPDGNFYVVVGQDNEEESETKIVVQVLKYNRSWTLLGTTDIPGGVSNAFKGIYRVFEWASLRMTLIGSTLVVHTGREMFVGADGYHHQSNISFMINTQNMELLNSAMPYTSHSFNQYVLNDGNKVYFLDHGDAYSRGLILSVYSYSADGTLKGERKGNIFPFMGETGENYTGCQATGFSMDGNTLITVGKSVPHDRPVNNETGYKNTLNQNIFMLLTDKNTLKSKHIWLTQYPVSGSKTELTEPRIIKISDNRYVILYSEETSGKSVLHYLLVDASGNQLLSKNYENVTIQTESQPILYKNCIIWVSGRYEDGENKLDLYKIPVVTRPLTKISLNQTTMKLNEGSKKKLTLSFVPANTDDVKDIQWTSSNPAAAVVSSNGTVTAKAYGKSTITAKAGKLKAACSVTVTVPASDKALSTPVLKLSQKRADKMHLSWNKISGAKGYRIYCRTSSKASYKYLVSAKNGVLSYDASVTPGKTYSFKIRAYGTKKDGSTKYSRYSSAKSKKAIVPVPANIRCDFGMTGTRGTLISWSKVTGASGYVVYKNGKAVKTLSVSQTSWTDTDAYNSSTGMYWIYDYYVRAYRTVNGKRIYSAVSKTVSL